VYVYKYQKKNRLAKKGEEEGGEEKKGGKKRKKREACLRRKKGENDIKNWAKVFKRSNSILVLMRGHYTKF